MHPVLHSTTTIKIPVRGAAFWIALFALTLRVAAHGGFDHVMGTVAKLENDTLTVKTAKGDIDVKLNDKTEITKGNQKAGAVDLKPGTRVVVDVMEGTKMAHSVKLGTAEPHLHDGHQ
jgi:hypothetical protein